MYPSDTAIACRQGATIGSRPTRRACALLMVTALAWSGQSATASTPAGTRIANTATLSIGQGDAATRINSNTVTLSVDEVLDVAIAGRAPINIAADTAADVAVPFIVTNLGNGAESFDLTGVVDRPRATIVGIAADEDGNGVYDLAIDTILNKPTIALDVEGTRRIFVIVRNAAGADGDVTVSASVSATTGHGAAGTIFTGAGTGGADAIVGTTGATATARTILSVRGDVATLEKSQSVVAPDGSARAVPGSIVTYRLDARFPRATAATELSDAIPVGTIFVPGSITLDGQPLTDAANDDAATFDGAAVRVALGDIATPGTRTIRFQARIQ